MNTSFFKKTKQNKTLQKKLKVSLASIPTPPQTHFYLILPKSLGNHCLRFVAYFPREKVCFFKKILRFRTVLFKRYSWHITATWLPFLPFFSGCHLAWGGDKIPGNTWNVDKSRWLLSKQNNQNGRERLGLEKHADVPIDESRLDQVEGAGPGKWARASHQSPRETEVVGGAHN